MRLALALAGLLGGVCWIAAYVVDRITDGGARPLTYAGTVLLALGVLGAGAGLVSRGAVWLRAVVSVCFLALAASVLLVLRQAGDELLLDAVVGVVAVVVAVAALARRPDAAVESAAGGHRAGRSHSR